MPSPPVDSSHLSLVLHGAEAAACVLVVGVLFALQRIYRRPFLVHWALSWSALALFHAASGVASEFGSLPAAHPLRTGLVALILALGYLQVSLLLSGTWLLLSARPLAKTTRIGLFVLPVLVACASALGTLAFGPSTRVFWRAGLLGIVSALAFAGAAIGLARRARGQGGFARALVAGLFALVGLVELGRLLGRFVVPESGFEPLPALVLPHVLALCLQLVLLSALLLLFFEEERKALLLTASALSQSEEHRRRAEHMEAVGRLAGGVAHDFNNLLTAISGHAELLLAGERGSEAPGEDLRAIQRASARAAELVRELLTFSRRQTVNPRAFVLDARLGEMRRMLERLLGEGVRLEFEPGTRGAVIHADPAQIESAVINLASNARDAMRGAGTLRLTTARVESAGPAASPWLAEGSWIRIELEDSGCGMSAEELGKIFEPYYTTKPGKGTGLGLASVYGIIKQSRGEIQVESTPGEGATFRIWLPRLPVPAEPVREIVPPAQVRGGRERILLVEDDDAVRRLTQRLLVQAGYRVEQVANADEASDRLHRSHEPFELVLSDIVMPGRPLREFIDELRLERPELRVLLMSGYSEATIHLRGIALATQHFLAKPFSSTTLLSAVRSALDEPERTTAGSHH